jgi:NADPH:quinone reductase
VGLKERGRLAPGETLLVLGAAGGMGLAAVSIGKALGAHVIAAVSTPAKAAAARGAGADETLTVERTSPDFGRLNDRIDIVFDPVGGEAASAALRTLHWGGRYLVIGFVGGIPAPVATNRLLLKGIEIVGVRAGEFSRRDPAAGARVRAAVDALAAGGAGRPMIGLQCAFDEAGDALARLSDGSVIGKAVVRLDPRR